MSCRRVSLEFSFSWVKKKKNPELCWKRQDFLEYI
jgi:hypothetical protein